MKKEKLKTFFDNYEGDMTPDVDVSEIKSHFGLSPQLTSARIKSKKKHWHLLLAVFLGILFILPSAFLIKYIYGPSYANDPNKELSKYLYYNFDEYSNQPFSTEEPLTNLKIEFYYGEKNNEQYVIVRTISNENYFVSINNYDNTLLLLDMENNLGSFLITELVLNCDIVITDSYNKTITKNIILEVIPK